MPEGRLLRTRRAYACPTCDGDGEVFDYEGTYRCTDCGGTGVRIEPLPTAPLGTAGALMSLDWLRQETLRRLGDQCRFAALVAKEYR